MFLRGIFALYFCLHMSKIFLFSSTCLVLEVSRTLTLADKPNKGFHVLNVDRTLHLYVTLTEPDQSVQRLPK